MRVVLMTACICERLPESAGKVVEPVGMQDHVPLTVMVMHR